MNSKKFRKMIDEPAMSDKTLLVTVEDLIITTFGAFSENRVNFKLLQTVLHILARQLRLLEQEVEIKFDDLGVDFSREQGYYSDESESYSSSYTSGEEGEDGTGRRKRREGRGKREKGSSKDREGKGGSRDHDGRGKERDGRSRGRRRGHDDEDEEDRERGGEGGAGRRRHEGDRGGGGRDAGRQLSGTSITVSEVARRGEGGAADKLLVAERGPTSHDRARPVRIGSIEVVTASQFALLGRAVKQLEQVTGPPPAPVLPDNQTLRKDLAKGRASLQDTMQAVQLNARVQAAEQGLYRMAELLTELAAMGALPPEFTGPLMAMQEYVQAAMAGGTAGQGGPGRAGGQGRSSERDGGVESDAFGLGKMSRKSGVAATSKMDTKKSTISQQQSASADVAFKAKAVTHSELQDILENMKQSVFKEITKMTDRANHSADVASNTSRSVAEKLNVAMQVDNRITTLFQQTADYAEQLAGFDSGLTTQMQSFQEQMAVMRSDLQGGLALLEAANTNAETAAILDLSERYQGLVIELDNTVHLHQNLYVLHQQISDELRSLIKCVELLREQKADRDEVLDGLRDKADISRLAGLLYEKDFAYARFEIEKRISQCYEKFHRQEAKWLNALRDLSFISNNKAEIVMLMALKESTNQELNDIKDLLHKLEILLGEPKAAILMRKLSKDGACAACLTRALMEPVDATYGKPQRLPPLRPPPVGADDLCLGDIRVGLPDDRDHICHRWVGGSHTLMSGNVLKERAEQMQLQTIPTKKFEGYGFDGKLYMMEEEMQPCAECNKQSTDDDLPPHPPAPTTGGGDQLPPGEGAPPEKTE